MDCIISEPIRILAHGHTEQRIRYRDIETEIPFLEKEAEKHSEENNQFPIFRYNSAELYNREMRDAYSAVKSYSLREIMSCYYTREFKKYKYGQVIASCDYLLKVLKLVENINNVFIGIEKASEQEATDIKCESETMREFYRSKRAVSGLISLLWDISVNVLDLQSDPHSIGIQKSIEKGHEFLCMVLTTHSVPAELAKKISSIYPNVPLLTFGDENGCDSKIADTEAYSSFMQVEGKLIKIMSVFIRFLENQFSYFVTSDSFLSNPIGKTLFVIPMSMYRKFNFPNSGLYRSEQFVFMLEAPVEMARKNLEFIRIVRESFQQTKKEAEQLLSGINNLKKDFSISDFIELYRKKHPMEKMNRLKAILESPVALERTTAMLIETRNFMISDAQKGMDPWYSKCTKDYKSIDKDTLYFLIKLFECTEAQLKCLPLTKFLRLFNLFSYSNQPEKRMNDHVRKYRNGKYRISQNYDAVFGSIMSR